MATAITIGAALAVAWWIGLATGRHTAQGECRGALEVLIAINEHNTDQVRQMEQHIRALQAEIEMRKEAIWPHVL